MEAGPCDPQGSLTASPRPAGGLLPLWPTCAPRPQPRWSCRSEPGSCGRLPARTLALCPALMRVPVLRVHRLPVPRLVCKEAPSDFADTRKSVPDNPRRALGDGAARRGWRCPQRGDRRPCLQCCYLLAMAGGARSCVSSLRQMMSAPEPPNEN